MPTAKSQTLSIGLHIGAVLVLVALTSHSVLSPPVVPDIHARIVPLAPLHRVYLNRGEEHSGGSNRTLLPARHGAPPPRAHRTFIPPQAVENPKLPMMATVAFDSPTVQVTYNQLGDPMSRLPTGGLGSHGRDGIGDSCCGGIGDVDRGTPGISSGPRHRVTPPQLIYKVEPEFSEEARKAKYSGIVELSIEVDTSGHARAFRVLRSPGLGLDEKAIEAVMQWRFKPGSQDGKAVVTTATIEVTFHLL